MKVFSAITAKGRAAMGDEITAWLAFNRTVKVIDAIVVASSDRKFHCLSIVVFCEGADLRAPLSAPDPLDPRR